MNACLCGRRVGSHHAEPLGSSVGGGVWPPLFRSGSSQAGGVIPPLRSRSLTEVSLQQTCESLAVASLVASHLVDGVVDGIQTVLLCNGSQVNLAWRVDCEFGATQGKTDLAICAKKNGLDAIHDTVHEMARDEARHGLALKGLLERYFK